jgi:predicted ester cyclase
LDEGVEMGNLDVMDELLAPDFVDRSLLPGQQPDRDSYKRGLAENRAAFSNLSIAIEDQVAEGDKVVGLCSSWARLPSHQDGRRKSSGGLSAASA